MSANQIYLALLFVALGQVCLAQNISINENGTAPNPYAILDIDAVNNDKGILIPRITSDERKSIAGLGASEEGLIVYEESSREFWYWDGGNWVQIHAQDFKLMDSDKDTEVKVEESPDEDVIRFDLEGQEKMVLVKNADDLGRLELVNANGSVFIGRGSGESAFQTAIENTAVGDSAMNRMLGGSYNTALGSRALYYSLNGDLNTAVGVEAMYKNTGTNNTACGAVAMRNAGGERNVAVGNGVLYSGQSNDNTGVGFYALFDNDGGYKNTAAGTYAMRFNDNGWGNVAIGYQALRYNEDGFRNVAIGHEALSNGGTLCNLNVAIGDSALRNNSADWNVAVGNNALTQNTTAQNNVGIGSFALSKNTTGEYNTALGSWALLFNSTGSGNTAVGRNAGGSNHVNEDCTFVGRSTGTSIDGLSNSTALGVNAVAYESDQVMIGSPVIGKIGGYDIWTTFSDGRYKTEVRDDVPGLEFITRLRPVTYHLDIPRINALMGIEMGTDVQRRAVERKTQEVITGLIAQEVEEVARELGFEFSGVSRPAHDKSTYALRYASFVTPLIKAVQEQQDQIEALGQENSALKSRLENIESRLALLTQAPAESH